MVAELGLFAHGSAANEAHPLLYARKRRAVHPAPLIGLIAQVLLIAALAGSVGLGTAGWVVGLTCAAIMNCGTGARPLAPRVRAARAGRLGDPYSGNARRRRRGTGRGLVPPARVGRAAGVAHGRCARARRGRRMGRATHHGGGAGRAVRRRGRCVPDPRPQRVRGPHRPARGCSRSARRATRSSRPGGPLPWMREPLPPRFWRKTVAATAGDRAGHRRGRRPAQGRDPGRPGRRTRPACRVVRPRRVVAAAPSAARPAAAAGDGCRPQHHRTEWRTGTRAHRFRRRAHGARPSVRVERPRRSGPADSPQARRVPEAPARGLRPPCRGTRPAPQRPTRAWPGSSARCSLWWSS